MAATGFTPISLYYTTTASAAPTAGNLVAGELAINTNDGVLYYKDSSGVVQSIASKAGNSGSFTNLAYTGTLTGGTGVVNLGSGQFYKDASGNVGIGSTSPSGKLDVRSTSGSGNAVYFRGGTYTDIAYATGIRFLQPSGTSNANRQFRFTSGDSTLSIQGTDGAGTDTTDAYLILQPSGGRVGIGTSSPSQILELSSASNPCIMITDTTNNAKAYMFASDSLANIGSASNFPVAFNVNDVEKMRIDTSGNLLINKSSTFTTANLQVTNTNSTGLTIAAKSNSGPATGNIGSGDDTWNAYWTFGRDNQTTGNFVFCATGTQKGYINVSTGAYTATSDLRLKKDITDLTYGLPEVLAMRPVTYLMNEEEDTAKKHIGFIAQEVKAVMDETVDDLQDEKTQFYGLDKSGLVPVLVKAIQELNAKVDAQAAEIATLKAK